MAALKYTDAGTDELGLFDDPVAFTKVTDEARRAEIVEIQAVNDTIRTLLATCAQTDLATFDDALAQELDDLDDRLDYYDYELVPISIEERDGAWFSPVAVTDFGDEDPGFPASNTIDGDNGTQWRHDVLHTPHFITWELRAYPKKVTKMRLRYGAGENIRERLTNITIKASKALSKIDDPSSVRATGINPTWPVGQGNIWFEIDWPSAVARARFIKLEFESEHGNNAARIREIEFRVITRRPQET